MEEGGGAEGEEGEQIFLLLLPGSIQEKTEAQNHLLVVICQTRVKATDWLVTTWPCPPDPGINSYDGSAPECNN